MHLTDRPSGPPTARILDLVRTPPRGGLMGIITTEKIQGTYTHFFGGKTIPCLDSLCQACDEKISRRWHGYFGLLTPKPSRHVLCEIPLQACEKIWEYHGVSGSLRGVKIQLARRNEKANGKVVVSLDTTTIGKFQLPEPANVQKNLRIIWGLDTREGVADDRPADAAALAKVHREVRADGND